MNPAAKSEILARLQNEILPLQGYKPFRGESNPDPALGMIRFAFPGERFPQGAIHEFVAAGIEENAAASGFIAGLVSTIIKSTGAIAWISSKQTVFPPGLTLYGMDPSKIIFMNARKTSDMLWVMEEALKCEALSAVVGDIPNLDFNSSRRFQLAVERSNVTGFVLRDLTPGLKIISSIARWHISSVPSGSWDGLPGPGFPRWKVRLLKVRNGKPGSWVMEWADGRFRYVNQFADMKPVLQQKTG